MTRHDDRRAEIMATAARLFAVSGFHGVSIDDLGSELGVSGPALYRYFAGKEAILTELLRDGSRQLLAGARERETSIDDPHSLVSALVDFHVDVTIGAPDVFAVQSRDIGSVPEPDRSAIREVQREYVDVWVQALLRAYPGVQQSRARSAAQAAFGLMNSTPHITRSQQAATREQLSQMAQAALAAGCVE